MTNLTNKEAETKAKSLLQEKFPEIFWRLQVANQPKSDNAQPFSSTRFSRGQEEILRKIETGTWTSSDEVRYCQLTDYNGDYPRNYWITVGGLLTKFGADLKQDLENIKHLGTELSAAMKNINAHDFWRVSPDCGCTKLEIEIIRFADRWANRIKRQLFIAQVEIEAARTRLTAARKLAKRLDELERLAWGTDALSVLGERVVLAQSEQATEDAFELHHMNAEVS